MWKRKELKAKAKAAFKNNYWKCVLVSLIFAIVFGAGSAATAKITGGQSEVTVNGQVVTGEQLSENIQQIISQVAAQQNISQEEVLEALVVVGSALAGVAMLFAMVSTVLRIFLWALFEIGADRFYTVNTAEKANLSEIFCGFSSGYIRNVLALFLRSLYIALWSLLFIIPGIVKTYSYRLIPYLLADHPEMSRKEAFRESRRLMKGSKWKAFILDLSFLGWDILSVFTFGLLQFFYVLPYKAAANAELYKALTSKETI